MNFQQAATARQLTPSSALQRLEYETCHIDHHKYRCPIYIWVSSAHYRNGLNVIFVYLEYRDATRACRYNQQTFATLEQARQFIHNQAAHIMLPDISSLQTRRSPVKSPLGSQPL